MIHWHNKIQSGTERRIGMTALAALAGVIGTTALIGGGAAGGAAVLQSGRDKEKAAANVAADEGRAAAAEKKRLAGLPAEAEAKAKEETERKRRGIQRSGGKTILSSQFGGATDTASKNLLGQ